MPVAEKANNGRIRYAVQGESARSNRSAGDINRLLAAERLRLAQSHTGSCSIELSGFWEARISLSAYSSAESAVAAWASRGPGAGAGRVGSSAARKIPVNAPCTPVECNE